MQYSLSTALLLLVLCILTLPGYECRQNCNASAARTSDALYSPVWYKQSNRGVVGVFYFFFNYFFLFGYRVWRRQAGVAESQCWGVALQDGVKSCRHELVFPGVPGRLNEPKLSSAGFVSLFISRQEWQFLFFILIWPLFCFLN